MPKRIAEEYGLHLEGRDLKANVLHILESGSTLFKGGKPKWVRIAKKELEVDGEQIELRYKIFRLLRGEILARLNLCLPSAQTLPIYYSDPVGMKLLSGVVAGAEHSFYGRSKSHDLSVVTRPGYEGRGYAMALGLMTNQIVTDVLKRHPQMQSRAGFEASICDTAEALDPGKKRNGWSSNIASILGFTLDPDEDPPIWIKTF